MTAFNIITIVINVIVLSIVLVFIARGAPGGFVADRVDTISERIDITNKRIDIVKQEIELLQKQIVQAKE